jgi:trk system potassium uptake protein
MNAVMAFFLFFFLTLGIVAVCSSCSADADHRDLRRGDGARQHRPGPRAGDRPGRQLRRPARRRSKWVLTFTMLLGRLELLTVFVLFTAAFWRG